MVSTSTKHHFINNINNPAHINHCFTTIDSSSTIDSSASTLCGACLGPLGQGPLGPPKKVKYGDRLERLNGIRVQSSPAEAAEGDPLIPAMAVHDRWAMGDRTPGGAYHGIWGTQGTGMKLFDGSDFGWSGVALVVLGY